MTLMPCNRLRDRLSLSETVLLAEVPEDRVRKDIERGWLTPKRLDVHGRQRLKFHWIDVFAFAAIYNNDILSGRTRRVLYNEFITLTQVCYADDILFERVELDKFYLSKIKSIKLHIDKYFFIDFSEVMTDVSPRVDMYAEGLKRIEEKDDVLGGDAVFINTRLSVKHVGGMFDSGEPMEAILEDYPYLKEADVRFARLYHLAHPTLGRPRNGIENRHELLSSS